MALYSEAYANSLTLSTSNSAICSTERLRASGSVSNQRNHPRAHLSDRLTVFLARLRQRTSQKMHEGTTASPLPLHVVWF